MNTLNDIFVEKLVKHKNAKSVNILKVLIVFAAVFISVSFLFTPAASIAAPIVFVAAGWGAWVLTRRLNFEFEYSLTNGELEVSLIVGYKKRKPMVSLRFSDIDFMAPVNERYNARFSDKRIETVYNAVSSDDSPDRWFIIFRKDGNLCKLIFEPNEKMVNGLHQYNPHGVMVPTAAESGREPELSES